MQEEAVCWDFSGGGIHPSKQMILKLTDMLSGRKNNTDNSLVEEGEGNK